MTKIPNCHGSATLVWTNNVSVVCWVHGSLLSVIVVCCSMSSVGCSLLAVDCRMSLSVVVVCSWLSGVGCRMLAVVCRCRLSLTFSDVGAQLWNWNMSTCWTLYLRTLHLQITAPYKKFLPMFCVWSWQHWQELLVVLTLLCSTLKDFFLTRRIFLSFNLSSLSRFCSGETDKSS